MRYETPLLRCFVISLIRLLFLSYFILHTSYFLTAGEPEKTGYTNRIIVRMDGKPVTEFDVTLYMRYADPGYFKLKDMIENEDRLAAVQEARELKALQELAQLRTLIAYADRLGLKIPEQHRLEMQKKFEEKQIEKFGSAEKYREQLASRKLKLEEVFKFELEREMATQLRLKEYRRMPQPTQQEIRNSYECNRNIFITPQRYHAGHFAVKKTKEGRSPGEARRIAESALAAVRAGKPFENASGNVSEITATADTVEWEKGNSSLLKSVAEAAEKLEPGGISGIIETDEAFHFVKLEKIVQGELQPLDDVWDRIDDALRARNWRRAKSVVMGKALDVVSFDPESFSLRTGSFISWKDFLSGNIVLRGPGEKE